MTAAGWIRFEQGQEGNRPPRRVYTITPEGEATFQKLLRENLGSYQPARFASDIGLAFIDTLPAGEALTLLKQRRAAAQEQLAIVEAAPEHPGGAQLMIQHQIHHLTSELGWLDEMIERLGQRTKGGHRQHIGNRS
jgi:hypothetical protein